MLKEIPVIPIDFRNCVSTDDIRNLLKENLNLSEWDDENPDDLLMQLKELKECKIYFKATNLVSKDISGYMNQMIDIFKNAGNMYDNIRFFLMIERTKIPIDFRNCVSTDEIRELLKKHLNLPEWNDKKPDDLLRALKEFEPSRIYFVGTNLMPDNIYGYMKQIIDIFNKIEDMYDNIIIYVRDVITIDFTNAKTVYDIHDIISDALDFPEWYGRNFDALWDLLTGYIITYEIHLKGTKDVEEGSYLQKIVEIFQKAESEYDAHKIIIE
ncbi:MAG: barstar family protein [Oscillospiraceae bacterium]|nr:barstar family protein [Oscillospiraceae bacterium]